MKVIPVVIGGLGKGAGGVRNRRTSRDHLNHGIFEVQKNTEKSPGDLRIRATTRNPVKDHQQTLV